MKFIALIFLTVSGPLMAIDKWDNQNDPNLFYEELQYNYDQLPKKGQLKDLPWSGNYWPTYQGGISYRWNRRTRFKEERYAYSLKDYRNYSRQEMATLSPAEKYDIYLGRNDYPVTNYERNRTQILRTVEGSSSYSPDFKIPTWEGLCHSWAPATYQYLEPDPITVTNRDGIEIPFYTSDLKALLTLKGHVLKATNQRFLGSRCYLDFKELTKKYKAGEITEREYLAQINSASCSDINPGTFHLILANRIGLKSKSFMIDITRDAEVWNQPVEAYFVKELARRSGASEGASRGTRSEVVVKVWVRYVAEVDTHHERTVTPKEMLKVAVYEYRLELNRDDEIIGGQWISYERPDFIWDETVPKFTGFFSPLEDLYNKSIAYATPSAWSEKKNEILNAGKMRLLKKMFINGVKNEVTKRKMRAASKPEVLKRMFVIEAARKALETKLEKEKRKRFLKKKLRTNVMGGIWSNVFLREVKDEVRKTKVAKKWKKLSKKAANLSSSAETIRRYPSEMRMLAKQFVEAAKMGNLEVMKKLKEQGADTTGLKAGLKQNELLSMVIAQRDPKLIEFLLRNGSESSPFLFKAIELRDLEVLKVLVKFNADLTQKNSLGQNALHIAAKLGMKDFVFYLSNFKDLLEEVDNEGKSALILAITGSGKRPDDTTIDIVDILINAGVNVNLRDLSGKTARSYATKGPFRNWIIRKMLKKAGGIKDV